MSHAPIKNNGGQAGGVPPRVLSPNQARELQSVLFAGSRGVAVTRRATPTRHACLRFSAFHAPLTARYTSLSLCTLSSLFLAPSPRYTLAREGSSLSDACSAGNVLRRRDSDFVPRRVNGLPCVSALPANSHPCPRDTLARSDSSVSVPACHAAAAAVVAVASGGSSGVTSGTVCAHGAPERTVCPREESRCIPKRAAICVTVAARIPNGRNTWLRWVGGASELRNSRASRGPPLSYFARSGRGGEGML